MDHRLSLAAARERLVDAKRTVAEGQSPAQEKQRAKRRLKEAATFGQYAERWFAKSTMAESTRATRRSVYNRDMEAAWAKRHLVEITPDDLRAHCQKIVDRGAPATAVHVRDILKQIYAFAKLGGAKVPNPADEVGPAAIATFVPKGRSLSPGEPMSRATFNRVTYAVVERAKQDKLPLGPFTVHDLRRTVSTLLNELGFNGDWVEKCLAHEETTPRSHSAWRHEYLGDGAERRVSSSYCPNPALRCLG